MVLCIIAHEVLGWLLPLCWGEWKHGHIFWWLLHQCQWLSKRIHV